MQESPHMEFKRQWKDDLLKWISAFANAECGSLLVGYDDQGQAVGIQHAQKLLEDIPNKLGDVLRIVVDVNLHLHGALESLHIQVPAYPYPVSYKDEYHYRRGSAKQELKGAALDRFFLKKQGLHWDAVPLPYIVPGELDQGALKRFCRQAVHSQHLPKTLQHESTGLLMERLRLMHGDRLKRAAALLFHNDPERFVSAAMIKIGTFGSINADLLHQDEITGNLSAHADTAIEVLKLKYLKALISHDGLYRKERYPVPMTALREAILNAVVHKDYARAVAIQISCYPDKLVIWSPGQLPDNWSLGKLMTKYATCPFNPDIANTFFLASLIESWCRGIEACQQDNYPLLRWEIESGGLWVTFRYAEAHVHRDLEFNTTVGVASEGVSGGVNVGVKEVLGFVRANQPIKASTIAVHYPQVNQRTIKCWLKTLREQGQIEFKVRLKRVATSQQNADHVKGPIALATYALET